MTIGISGIHFALCFVSPENYVAGFSFS